MRRPLREHLEDAEALERQAASERVAYYGRFAPRESPGFLCDAGCGNGASLGYWKELGFKAFGVDDSLYRFSRWLADRPGGFVLVADVRHLPFRSNAFWPGDQIGAFRWHARPDVLLPSVQDVARFARAPGAELECLPLSGRLRFRQIGRRFWGRLLRGPVDIFLRLLDAMGTAIPRNGWLACIPTSCSGWVDL